MPGEHGFCGEHSEVMRCLGALEAGQNNMTESIKKIEGHLATMANSVSNNKITTAVEKTKSGVLYAAVVIVAAGGVAALLNFLFKYL